MLVSLSISSFTETIDDQLIIGFQRIFCHTCLTHTSVINLLNNGKVLIDEQSMVGFI